MDQQLLEWIGRFSYAAVYLLLSATGIGVPISEDLVLLSAGTVCSTGHALLAAMLPVAWAGVLTADTLLFRIGSKLGPKVIEHPKLQLVLTPERVARIRERFRRFGVWTIFVARFIPGVRMPTFLLAGGFGVTQTRFWLADGLAVLIFAPTLVWLGYRFGGAALPHVRAFGGWVLLIAAIGVAIAIALSRLRRRSGSA